MTQAGEFNAFFSGDSRAPVDLGTLGGASSYGMVINSAGKIAGSAQISQGFMNAVVWNGGQIQTSGHARGVAKFAYDVGDAGTVVGS